MHMQFNAHRSAKSGVCTGMEAKLALSPQTSVFDRIFDYLHPHQQHCTPMQCTAWPTNGYFPTDQHAEHLCATFHPVSAHQCHPRAVQYPPANTLEVILISTKVHLSATFHAVSAH